MSVNIWGQIDGPTTNYSSSITSHVSLNNYVKKSGDKMAGNLNMNGFIVTGLPTELAGLDDTSACSYGATRTLIGGQGHTVHRGGDSGMSTDLKIGTLDDKNVELIRNGIHYLTLDANHLKLNTALDANGNGIYNLSDPHFDGDAVTKRYLYSIKGEWQKCHVGYVPNLLSNQNKIGYACSASSEHGENYIAANAFNDNPSLEWATAGINYNFWLKLECPEAVAVWKVGLRGRNSGTERIYNWRLEGSKNDITYSSLMVKTRTYLGNTYQEFLVEQSHNAHRYYRLFCMNAEGVNPGLSKFQLFVYNG